jgi:hypothetical protein
MKKYIIYNLLGLFLVSFLFVACDGAEQDASPIVSPDNNPTVTITSDRTGSVIEGETITFTITFDKPIEETVTFAPIVGGSLDDHDYEMPESVILQPYTTSVDFQIDLFEDFDIEGQETLSIQFDIPGIAEEYLVQPGTTFEVFEYDVKDFVDPNKLVINFAWDTDDDFDMVTFSDTPAYPATLWGTGGATSHNPEIDTSIWLDDPAGTYYVCIIDWDAGINWDYTYTIAHPDGTVQTIKGTFNGTTYPYTYFVGPASWGSPNCYKILKVENTNAFFTVTAL